MMQPRRSIALSYTLSGLLHAGLVTGLVLWSLPSRWRPATAPMQTALRPSSLEHDADRSQKIDSPDPLKPHIVPGEDALAETDPADAGLADFTRSQLQQAREALADRSAAEQTDDLKALAERLNNVSSAESLTQLTEAIAPWIGSRSARVTQPTEIADDQPFDVTTAQMSDVLKQQTSERVQYVAVLMDAAGHTQQTPLDEADGERLFEVFQLMKQFPLLETVYRKTVMGLLDRLIQEQQVAEDSPKSVEDGEDTAPQQPQQQN